MPFDNTPVVSPIDEIKTILREGGWIRRSYAEPNGHCVVGAALQVLGNSNRTFIRAAHKALGLRGISEDVIYWNDHCAKDLDDVLNLVEEARQFLPK